MASLSPVLVGHELDHCKTGLFLDKRVLRQVTRAFQYREILANLFNSLTFYLLTKNLGVVVFFFLPQISCVCVHEHACAHMFMQMHV